MGKYIYLIVGSIVLVLLAYLNTIKYKHYTNEHFSSSSKYALAILCVKPNPIHINFYKQFSSHYDVYFICDVSEPLDQVDDVVRIIQIADEECISAGYTSSTSATIRKEPTSWDKALYYFAEKSEPYKCVWLLEDDVFIPELNTLVNIDSKYVSSIDLLTCSHVKNEDGNVTYDGWPHWNQAKEAIKNPWFSSMSCCVRVSNNLMKSIKDYVAVHNCLFFIEVMFNTLIEHNNLTIQTPDELKTITYNHHWNYEDISPSNIYHPIKDVSVQESYRKKLNAS